MQIQSNGKQHRGGHEERRCDALDRVMQLARPFALKPKYCTRDTVTRSSPNSPQSGCARAPGATTNDHAMIFVIVSCRVT